MLRSLFFSTPLLTSLRISSSSYPNLPLKQKLLQLPKLPKKWQHWQITHKLRKLLTDLVERPRCLL
jgi:hypothetical protein